MAIAPRSAGPYHPLVDDIWVCDGCKSINRRRATTCYHCAAPRSEAMDAPGMDRRVETAALGRATRAYVATWPLAAVTTVLLVVVAALGLFALKLQMDAFPALREAFADAVSAGRPAVDQAVITQSAQTALLSLVRGGLALLALLCLAAWLAIVTRNVPLLGGGVPSRDPVRAFAYTLIPVWNLFKVPGTLQDLLYRLDPVGGGALMVVAAWLGLAGSSIVGVAGSWAITWAGLRAIVPAAGAGDMAAVVRAFGAILDQSLWLGALTGLMSAMGTVLLAAIMVRVELRCADRDREVRARLAAAVEPAADTRGEPAAGDPGEGEGATDPGTIPTAAWRTRIDTTSYYHSPSAPALPGPGQRDAGEPPGDR